MLETVKDYEIVIPKLEKTIKETTEHNKK